jgi:hypothetical protein
MVKKAAALLAISSALLGSIAGCADRRDASSSDTGIRQTHFPGEVTAGGGTSGEVMERSKKVASSGAPSGTPGIPEGSGGNTGGAALGGTTSPAAATKDTQESGSKPPGSTPPSGNR